MFPGGGPPPELPDNVTVSIVRHGKEPPKITVTRGDEKWEITDKELDKLPEELRPARRAHVRGRPVSISNDARGYALMVSICPASVSKACRMAIFILGLSEIRRHVMVVRSRWRTRSRPRTMELHRLVTAMVRLRPLAPSRRTGLGFSGGFQPPMMPGQVPPELMERLDRLDHRLDMLQDELRHLHDGWPRQHTAYPPAWPRSPMVRRVTINPVVLRREMITVMVPPGMHGGPPPADHDHRGPPPGDDNDHGPPGGPPHNPPPGDQ